MDSVLLVREEGKWIQVTDTALTCTRCLLKEQRTEIIGSCGDCSLNTFWILSCVVLFHSHHKEKYTRLYDPNFSFKRKKKHVRESWGVSSPPCRALSHWACPGGAGTAAGQWAPGAQGSSMSQQTLNVNFFLLFCPSWILLCSPEWLCSPAHVISSVDCLQGKDYHELYAGGKRMLSCFFKSILRKWWRRIEIQSCRHLSLKFSSPFVWKPTQKGRWAGGWGSLSQMWWQRVTRNISGYQSPVSGIETEAAWKLQECGVLPAPKDLSEPQPRVHRHLSHLCPGMQTVARGHHTGSGVGALPRQKDNSMKAQGEKTIPFIIFLPLLWC